MVFLEERSWNKSYAFLYYPLNPSVIVVSGSVFKVAVHVTRSLQPSLIHRQPEFRMPVGA